MEAVLHEPVKAIDFFPPPPPLYCGDWGREKRPLRWPLRIHVSLCYHSYKRNRGIFKWNKNWGEEENTFSFFFFFPFPSPSFVLLLNQTDVVINLHSAAQLMWQSTKLIPLCKIQFTSGFSFFFFFLQNYVNFPINWRDHVSFLYCT